MAKRPEPKPTTESDRRRLSLYVSETEYREIKRAAVDSDQRINAWIRDAIARKLKGKR